METQNFNFEKKCISNQGKLIINSGRVHCQVVDVNPGLNKVGSNSITNDSLSNALIEDEANFKMVDFFDQLAIQARLEIWNIIKKSPNQLWLILTSKSAMIKSQLPPDWTEKGYSNVWITSADFGMAKNVECLSNFKGQITRLKSNKSTKILNFDASIFDKNKQGLHLWVISEIELRINF